MKKGTEYRNNHWQKVSVLRTFRTFNNLLLQILRNSVALRNS